MKKLIVYTDGGSVRAFRVDAEPPGRRLEVHEIDLTRHHMDPCVGRGERESGHDGSPELSETFSNVSPEVRSVAECISSIVLREETESWHFVAPPQMFWDLWDLLSPRARMGLERTDREDLVQLLRHAAPSILLHDPGLALPVVGGV